MGHEQTPGDTGNATRRISR